MSGLSVLLSNILFTWPYCLLVGIVLLKKNNSAKTLTTLTTMTDLFHARQQGIDLPYSQLCLYRCLNDGASAAVENNTMRQL
jgi:hypothetical protein